jgi:transposase-like protein
MNNQTQAMTSRSEKSNVLIDPNASMSSAVLGEMTLRDLLGEVISGLAQAERKVYLGENPLDKGNGTYSRNLVVGSMPLEIEVPRVRSGDFRPSLLPDKHQRGYPEEAQNILLGLLVSSRSLSSAKQALKQLGLPFSEKELETVAGEILQDFDLRHTRPIESDMIALFLDGKYLEIRDGNQLKPYTLYVVIGLNREGYKRVLACLPEEGRESLENWKKVLRKLIDRGLRRVLLTVQDDFSGLDKIAESFFPNTQLQLCTVHMLRNARAHMNKEDATLFVQQFRTIRHSWNIDSARSQFEEACQGWKEKYPTFMDYLLKKRDKYLAFLKFPTSLRRTFATTNSVEALNRQFEKIRLNNSGYFQSIRDLQIKVGLSIQMLEEGKWSKPTTYVRENLQQLNRLFEQHFECDSMAA